MSLATQAEQIEALRKADSANAKTPPIAGVFTGLSDEQYRKIGAWNHSAIVEIDRAPIYAWRAWMGLDHEDTEALRFGRCFHVATLQPERYSELIRLGPINPKPDDEGNVKCYGQTSKKWREAEADAPPGVTLVDQETEERVRTMVAAMHDHRAARDMLESKGTCETVIVWNEAVEVDGEMVTVPLKLKADKLCAPHWIGDWKSTEDASPEGFARSIVKYRYPTQLYHYERGAFATFGEMVPAFLCCVEKTEPHGVGVYTLSQKWREIGAQRWREKIQKLARCLASGRFPCYAQEVVEIEPPAYELARFVDGR